MATTKKATRRGAPGSRTRGGRVRGHRDLLLYELGVALAAEKAAESSLRALARAASDRELAQGLERHVAETKGHAAKVEEAFRVLGEKPWRLAAPGLEGIDAQREVFDAAADDDLPQTARDLALLTAAMHVEHFEIATYESLILKAQPTNDRVLVRLLDANLSQEQLMVQRARILEQRLNRRLAFGAEPPPT